jgi:hypothetical protein
MQPPNRPSGPPPSLPPRMEMRHLAVQAMVGILSSGKPLPSPTELARMAVDYAEALLKEMDARM